MTSLANQMREEGRHRSISGCALNRARRSTACMLDLRPRVGSSCPSWSSTLCFGRFMLRAFTRFTSRKASVQPSLNPRSTLRFASPALAQRMSSTLAQERYLADAEPPVCSLTIKDAFAALTKSESESRAASSDEGNGGAELGVLESPSEVIEG